MTAKIKQRTDRYGINETTNIEGTGMQDLSAQRLIFSDARFRLARRGNRWVAVTFFSREQISLALHLFCCVTFSPHSVNNFSQNLGSSCVAKLKADRLPRTKLAKYWECAIIVRFCCAAYNLQHLTRVSLRALWEAGRQIALALEEN